MGPKDRAVERLQAIKWREAPRKMLIKAALQEIVDAGAGSAGLVLMVEIERLRAKLGVVGK